MLITTRVIAPFEGRTVTFTHTFEGGHPSLPQVSSSTLRFLDEGAVQDALERSGFKVEEQFGDFAGRPLFTRQSRDHHHRHCEVLGDVKTGAYFRTP